MNAMLPAQATNVSAGTSIRSLLAAALSAVMKPGARQAAQVAAQPAVATGKLDRAFSLLTESSEAREMRLQQAYLAEATDIYDLEYRSRAWDRQTRSNPNW